MEINNELVKAVKKHIRNELHNVNWHEFDRSKEVQAIIYAIDYAQLKTNADIIEEAKKYITAQTI